MKTNRILAILYRHLVLWRRDFDKIAETFWWPIVDLIVWGFVTIYLQKQTGATAEAVSFFLGGVIFWSVINKSQLDVGMTFLQEAWDRNLINVFASPITKWEFLTATLLLGLIKVILSVIAVGLLAIFLYAFNIFKLGWYFIPFMINLLVMGWWIGIFINGIIIRYGYRVQAFAWTLIFAFQPISAVFYPVSVLPPFLQIVARLTPASYTFEGMRAVLISGTFSLELLLLGSLLNLIYLVLSLLFYSRMFNAAQKHGYLIQFS
ncbi:ABC transporter permease [Candidatus Gottesmanbacteria bacterium]|nr:ABC transporter permease [Candidatus Gottesmanbacteria bacterium]